MLCPSAPPHVRRPAPPAHEAAAFGFVAQLHDGGELLLRPWRPRVWGKNWGAICGFEACTALATDGAKRLHCSTNCEVVRVLRTMILAVVYCVVHYARDQTGRHPDRLGMMMCSDHESRRMATETGPNANDPCTVLRCLPRPTYGSPTLVRRVM